jgi:hypothetical protein
VGFAVRKRLLVRLFEELPGQRKPIPHSIAFGLAVAADQLVQFCRSRPIYSIEISRRVRRRRRGSGTSRTSGLLQREATPLRRWKPITHQLRAGQFRSACRIVRSTICPEIPGELQSPVRQRDDWPVQLTSARLDCPKIPVKLSLGELPRKTSVRRAREIRQGRAFPTEPRITSN